MKIEIDVNSNDNQEIANAVTEVATFIAGMTSELRNTISASKIYSPQPIGGFSMAFRKPGKTPYFYLTPAVLNPAIDGNDAGETKPTKPETKPAKPAKAETKPAKPSDKDKTKDKK